MESNREEFLREARVMMKLEHPCIVQLIALCKGPPLMMVTSLNNILIFEKCLLYSDLTTINFKEQNETKS